MPNQNNTACQNQQNGRNQQLLQYWHGCAFIHAAMFVFLAAATGTRIVSSSFHCNRPMQAFQGRKFASLAAVRNSTTNHSALARLAFVWPSPQPGPASNPHQSWPEQQELILLQGAFGSPTSLGVRDAVHGVEAKRIGGERARWSPLLGVPLAAAACTVGVALADLVAPGIRRLRSAARCKFPFGLGEEPVRLAGGVSVYQRSTRSCCCTASDGNSPCKLATCPLWVISGSQKPRP